MRLLLRYIIVMAAAVYLAYGALPRLMSADFIPDVGMITIVYVASAVGGWPAVLAGFLLGLGGDLFGWGPVGVGALTGTFAGFVFSRFRGHIYEYSLLVPAVFAVIATTVKNVLAFTLLAIFAGPVSFGWHVVGKLGLAALVTGVTALPLLFVYWRLMPAPRRVYSLR